MNKNIIKLSATFIICTIIIYLIYFMDRYPSRSENVLFVITSLTAISSGLAALGTLWFFKAAKSKYFDYFKNLSGGQNFILWITISNILFISQGFIQIEAYNLLIVNNGGVEVEGGNIGGYFATEDVALKYHETASVIYITINTINILVFLISYYFKLKFGLKIPIRKIKIIPVWLIVGSTLVSLIIFFGLCSGFPVITGG